MIFIRIAFLCTLLISIKLFDVYADTCKTVVKQVQISSISSSSKDDSIKNIVLAGPATYKTKFLSYVQEEWRNNNKNILLEDLSSAFAINELTNRQTLQKLASEYQVLEESAILNEFEKRLGNEFEKISYGLDQCLQCAEQGALESILIVDTLIKTENETEKTKIVLLMNHIDKTKVKYFIVDNKSENGKIIQNFGGLVGLLRYAMYFDEAS